VAQRSKKLLCLRLDSTVDVINYILWEACPNAGKEATGLEPHPCIVSLVRIAVFCAHWTEPPRRGAKLSLGPCACCLRWRNHPSSPWEVGGKKPPGDGSTTLAPRARFAPFPSCTLGKITSLLLGLLLHACVVPAAESRSFRGCAP